MEVKRKRLTREQKREQAVVDLINQMFIIAGHQVIDEIKLCGIINRNYVWVFSSSSNILPITRIT